MFIRSSLVLLVSLVFLAACDSATESDVSDAALADIVGELRSGSEVPAMGAVVASPEGVMAVAVDGIRKRGTNDPAQNADSFHIGSVAKTMTATVAGLLVESGDLSWGTKVAEIFPEAVAGGRDVYHDIDLAQLLSHEAGIRHLTTDEEIAEMPELTGPVMQQRRELVDWLLKQPPVAAVGEEYAYSNGGFVIAAAMMEAVSGSSWETLIQTRLFDELGMEEAGFGWPGQGNVSAGDFVWGHRMTEGESRPVDPDGSYRLPEVLAPAGDVHASMGDMGRYAAAYLRAWQGDPSILQTGTLRAMFEPRINSGLGWGIQPLMGHDPVAVYAGSADTFMVMIALIPEAERAVVVAANAADEEAERTVIELLKRSIETAAGRPDA